MPPSKTPRPPGQSGFSLIEVLVAILIFSFGLLGLIGLQSRAIQFSVNAEDRTVATSLVGEAAAQMYTLRTATNFLATPEFTAWKTKVETPSVSGLQNAVATATSVAATATTPAFVRITVEWQPNNTPAGKKSSFTTDVLSISPSVPAEVIPEP